MLLTEIKLRFRYSIAIIICINVMLVETNMCLHFSFMCILALYRQAYVLAICCLHKNAN